MRVDPPVVDLKAFNYFSLFAVWGAIIWVGVLSEDCFGKSNPDPVKKTFARAVVLSVVLGSPFTTPF